MELLTPDEGRLLMLRQGHLQPEAIYSEVFERPEDIIYQGSDDDLDETSRHAKRQRYEEHGARYLKGHVPRLLSTSLRGPFDAAWGWKNPWLSKDQPPVSHEPQREMHIDEKTQVKRAPIRKDPPQGHRRRSARIEDLTMMGGIDKKKWLRIQSWIRTVRSGSPEERPTHTPGQTLDDDTNMQTSVSTALSPDLSTDPMRNAAERATLVAAGSKLLHSAKNKPKAAAAAAVVPKTNRNEAEPAEGRLEVVATLPPAKTKKRKLVVDEDYVEVKRKKPARAKKDKKTAKVTWLKRRPGRDRTASVDDAQGPPSPTPVTGPRPGGKAFAVPASSKRSTAGPQGASKTGKQSRPALTTGRHAPTSGNEDDQSRQVHESLPPPGQRKAYRKRKRGRASRVAPDGAGPSSGLPPLRPGGQVGRMTVDGSVRDAEVGDVSFETHADESFLFRLRPAKQAVPVSDARAWPAASVPVSKMVRTGRPVPGTDGETVAARPAPSDPEADALVPRQGVVSAVSAAKKRKKPSTQTISADPPQDKEDSDGTGCEDVFDIWNRHQALETEVSRPNAIAEAHDKQDCLALSRTPPDMVPSQSAAAPEAPERATPLVSQSQTAQYQTAQSQTAQSQTARSRIAQSQGRLALLRLAPFEFELEPLQLGPELGSFGFEAARPAPTPTPASQSDHVNLRQASTSGGYRFPSEGSTTALSQGKVATLSSLSDKDGRAESGPSPQRGEARPTGRDAAPDEQAGFCAGPVHVAPPCAMSVHSPMPERSINRSALTIGHQSEKEKATVIDASGTLEIMIQDEANIGAVRAASYYEGDRARDAGASPGRLPGQARRWISVQNMGGSPALTAADPIISGGDGDGDGDGETEAEALRQARPPSPDKQKTGSPSTRTTSSLAPHGRRQLWPAHSSAWSQPNDTTKRAIPEAYQKRAQSLSPRKGRELDQRPAAPGETKSAMVRKIQRMRTELGGSATHFQDIYPSGTGRSSQGRARAAQGALTANASDDKQLSIHLSQETLAAPASGALSGRPWLGSENPRAPVIKRDSASFHDENDVEAVSQSPWATRHDAAHVDLRDEDINSERMDDEWAPAYSPIRVPSTQDTARSQIQVRPFQQSPWAGGSEGAGPVGPDELPKLTKIGKTSSGLWSALASASAGHIRGRGEQQSVGEESHERSMLTAGGASVSTVSVWDSASRRQSGGALAGASEDGRRQLSTPQASWGPVASPSVQFSIKSFASLNTPCPDVMPGRLSGYDQRSVSQPSGTQALRDAALSNPWGSARSRRNRRSGLRVSFGPLPGEQDYDELRARGDRPRPASPPPRAAVGPADADVDGQFRGHFDTMMRRRRSGDSGGSVGGGVVVDNNIDNDDDDGNNDDEGGPRFRMRERLLPSSSQQHPVSPAIGAMAEAFKEADAQRAAAAGFVIHDDSGIGQQSPWRQASPPPPPPPPPPYGADDVVDVLQNLNEFFNPRWDVGVDLPEVSGQLDGAGDDEDDDGDEVGVGVRVENHYPSIRSDTRAIWGAM